MKLGYVIIYVPDVPEALGFYERAFGLKTRFLHESHQYGELETGACALAFVDENFVTEMVGPTHRNRADLVPAGAEIGLVSEDVPSAYSRALAAGAVAVKAPVTKPWGQVVSYVRDSNGFLVEICSAVG